MADSQFNYFSGDGVKSAMTGYVNGALQTNEDPTQGGRFTFVDGNGGEGGLIGKLRDAAGDPTYGSAVITGAQTVVGNTDTVHGTSMPYTHHYTAQFSYNDSTSTLLSATEALKVGVKESMSIKETVEVIDVEESVELSVDVTLSATESRTWTKSNTYQFSSTSDFQVDPGQKLVISTTYTSSEIKVPYVQRYYLGGKSPDLSVPSGDYAIATNYSDWLPYPGGDPNDRHETWFFNPDGAGYYINLWNAVGPAESKKWDSGPVKDGNVDAAVSIYAMAGDLEGGFGSRFETTPTYSVSQKSVASGADPASLAANEALRYGLNVKMERGGDITLTDKADVVVGSAAADTIRVAGGFDRVNGGKGDDKIIASDTGTEVRVENGPSVDHLHGGAGDDHIIVRSQGTGSIVKGGAGDDEIFVRAASTFLSGGGGDDSFRLAAASLGTHIADHLGVNKLKIDAEAPGDEIVFIRQGDALFVALDGAEDTDPNEQFVWSDFFAGKNRVTVLDSEGRSHMLHASALGEAEYGVVSEVIDQLIYA